MDQEALVKEQIDAGARFLAAFQECFPIRVAFWLKDGEDGGLSLYVVSDEITDDNFDVAYDKVGRIAQKHPDPWFDPFQVKLLGAHESLAKAVAELQRRYSGRVPPRFDGRILGGRVQELYIYPSSHSAPAR